MSKIGFYIRVWIILQDLKEIYPTTDVRSRLIGFFSSVTFQFCLLLGCILGGVATLNLFLCIWIGFDHGLIGFFSSVTFQFHLLLGRILGGVATSVLFFLNLDIGEEHVL